MKMIYNCAARLFVSQKLKLNEFIIRNLMFYKNLIFFLFVVLCLFNNKCK
jgi:hypothetical protein